MEQGPHTGLRSSHFLCLFRHVRLPGWSACCARRCLQERCCLPCGRGSRQRRLQFRSAGMTILHTSQLLFSTPCHATCVSFFVGSPGLLPSCGSSCGRSSFQPWPGDAGEEKEKRDSRCARQENLVSRQKSSSGVMPSLWHCKWVEVVLAGGLEAGEVCKWILECPPTAYFSSYCTV